MISLPKDNWETKIFKFSKNKFSFQNDFWTNLELLIRIVYQYKKKYWVEKKDE